MSALRFLFVRQLRAPWTPSVFAERASAPTAVSHAAERGSVQADRRRSQPIAATGK